MALRILIGVVVGLAIGYFLFKKPAEVGGIELVSFTQNGLNITASFKNTSSVKKTASVLVLDKLGFPISNSWKISALEPEQTFDYTFKLEGFGVGDDSGLIYGEYVDTHHFTLS